MTTKTIRMWQWAMATIATAGAASAAYAAGCCRISMNWGDPMNVCSGSSNTVCEGTAASCNAPPAGQAADHSCEVAGELRSKACYYYVIGVGGGFATAPCNSPPAGYTFVAPLGGGSCCWAKNATITRNVMPGTIQECNPACAPGTGNP